MDKEFRVIDPVITEIDGECTSILDKHFYWMDTYYISVPYGPKKRKQRMKFVIGRHNGKFLLPTAMIPDAIAILKKNGIKVTVKDKYESIPYKKPEIPGLTFRKDQIRLIKAAVTSEWQRGVLVAPTGTGKTVIVGGIIKAIYPKAKILFLAHTTDLVQQFASELLKWGLTNKDVGILSGKNYEWKPITCSTIQKLSKISESEWENKFDCILVDECFHKNTPITMADGSRKKIKDIIVGDKVLTSQGNKNVTRTFINKIPLSRLCKITLSNGKTIVCSVDHVFKTKKGEIKAKDLLNVPLTEEKYANKRMQ